MRLVIEVEGGVVQFVYAETIASIFDADVIVLDLDNDEGEQAYYIGIDALPVGEWYGKAALDMLEARPSMVVVDGEDV